jgi:hypothetical protein
MRLIILLLLIPAVHAGVCYDGEGSQVIDCGALLQDLNDDGYPDCPNGSAATSIHCSEDPIIVAAFSGDKVGDTFHMHKLTIANSYGSAYWENQEIYGNILDSMSSGIFIGHNSLTLVDDSIHPGPFRIGHNGIYVDQVYPRRNGEFCSACYVILNNQISAQVFYQAPGPGQYSVSLQVSEAQDAAGGGSIEEDLVPDISSDLAQISTNVNKYVQMWEDLSNIRKILIILTMILFGVILYGFIKNN